MEAHIKIVTECFKSRQSDRQTDRHTWLWGLQYRGRDRQTGRQTYIPGYEDCSIVVVGTRIIGIILSSLPFTELLQGACCVCWDSGTSLQFKRKQESRQLLVQPLFQKKTYYSFYFLWPSQSFLWDQWVASLVYFSLCKYLLWKAEYFSLIFNLRIY